MWACKHSALFPNTVKVKKESDNTAWIMFSNSCPSGAIEIIYKMACIKILYIIYFVFVEKWIVINSNVFGQFKSLLNIL